MGQIQPANVIHVTVHADAVKAKHAPAKKNVIVVTIANNKKADNQYPERDTNYQLLQQNYTKS